MRNKSFVSIVLVVAVALAGLVLVPVAGAAPPPGVKLDPRLRAHPLLQYGAQAEPGKRVRVIVQKARPGVSSQAIAQAAGASVLEEFNFIQSLVLEIPQQAVLALARNPNVRYISPDSAVRFTAIPDSNLKTFYNQGVNAPAVWNNTNAALQATGSGVTVAVLDSGIKSSHPDFANGSVLKVNVNKSTQSTQDFHGHGTHVAGTINGRSSSGSYIGVAPGATVLNLKVSDDQGMAKEADLLRGMQWVYDNRATHNIRVVNLSVSAGTASSYTTSPTAAAVEQLWFGGVVVVVASGNRGAAADAVWYAPANDPYVITVGCYDDNQTTATTDGGICGFSSRGSTQDNKYKPEVVAPGRRLVAPLAGNNVTLVQQLPADRIVDGDYLRLSGTSMSAPVVAGVAALLLERYPTLTPNQVKYLLMNSSRAYTGQPDSAGLVDAAQLLSNAASGLLGTANQGLTPNSGIDPATGAVAWGTSYWDTSYWDTSYWDTSTWEVAIDFD